MAESIAAWMVGKSPVPSALTMIVSAETTADRNKPAKITKIAVSFFILPPFPEFIKICYDTISNGPMAYIFIIKPEQLSFTAIRLLIKILKTGKLFH